MKTTPSCRFPSVRPLLGSIAVALLAQAVSAQASSSTWTSTTSGVNWDAGTWNNGVADGSGSIATFNANFTTDPFVVHLNASHTLSGLVVTDTDPTGSGVGWTLDTTNSSILTLDGAATITINQLGVAASQLSGYNKAATISAVVAGSAGLVKAGVGQLTLSGANTYSGVTTVNAGILDFAKTAALYGGTSTNWTASNIVVNSGGTFAVNVGGTGEFGVTDVSTLLTNLSTVNNNGLKAGSSFGIDTTNAGTGGVTYSNVIANSVGTGGGAIGLVKLGTGQLTLGGANTYTGMTQVLGGVLDVGVMSGNATTGVSASSGIFLANGAVIQGSGTLTRKLSGSVTPAANQISAASGGFAARGGSLTVNLMNGSGVAGGLIQFNGGGYTFGSSLVFGSSTSDNEVFFQNPLDINSGSARAVIVNTGANALGSMAELQGVISSGSNSNLGTDGMLSKQGTGTLVLNAANTYSGQTQVTAGTVQIKNAAGLGTKGFTYSTGLGGITTQGATVVSSGATLDLNGQANVNEIIQLSGAGVGGSGALVNNSTTAASIGSGVASFTISAGTNAASDSTSPTITVSGGGATSNATVVSSLGLTAQSFTVGAQSEVYSVAPTVTISGGGGVNGAATAILTNGTISGFTITNRGEGYTSAPTLALSGATQSGSAPTVTGNASNFILDTKVTDYGSGYTSAPTIVYGSGSGNVGTANLTKIVLAADSAIGGSGDLAIAPVISGAFAVTKVGAGTLTLSGSNTYTGTTTISGGIVNLSNVNALAGSTLTTTSGGSLVFDSSVSGHAFTFGGLAATSAGVGYDIALQDNAATPNAVALTVGNNNAAASYAGVLSGSGSLTKVGTGTQTLSGANTYTGATVVNSGTLQIGAGATSGSLATSSVTGSSGGFLAFNRSDSISFAPSISGTIGVQQLGAGVLTLTGNNTYSGPTTVYSGTLAAGSATAFGSNSNMYLNNVTGAVLNLAGYNATISSLVQGGAAGGNVTLGSGTLTLGGNVNNSYAGIISGAGGIIRSGTAGTQTFTGTNTYDGVTTINGYIPSGSGNGAILAISNAKGLGSTVGNTVVSGTTGGFGCELQISGNISVAEALNISGEGPSWGGAVTNTSGNNTLSGAITIGTANARIASSAGNLTVTGGVTSSSNMNLILASGGGAGTALNVTTAPIQIGTGTLNVYGGTVGTVGLGATGNTFSMLQISYVGSFKALAANVMPSAVAVAMGNGTGAGQGTATFDLNGFDQTIGDLYTGSVALGVAQPRTVINTSTSAATLTVNEASSTSNNFDGLITDGVSGGTLALVKGGTGRLMLSGTNTYTGATIINAGTLLIGGITTATGTSGNLVGTSGVSGSAGATLAFSRSNAFSFDAAISGALGVSQTGAGTTTLTKTNTYSGVTNITSGTLAVSNGYAIGDTSAVNFTNTASTTLLLNNSETIGSLAGGGTTGGNVNLGSNALTIGGDSTSPSYAGAISGVNGSLIKIGTGNQTLSGANTYTGATTINSGTLQIGAGSTTGSLATASVTGSSGATLAFNHSDTVTFAPVISGGLGVLQVGNGASAVSNLLALTGSNTYTGLTTVRNGTLRVDSVSALGSTSGIQLGDALTVGGSDSNGTYAVLQLNAEGGNFTQNVNTWVSSGNTTTGQGRVRIAASTNATLSGNVALANSTGSAVLKTEFNAFDGKTLTISGAISSTGGSGGVVFNGSGASVGNASTVVLSNSTNNFNLLGGQAFISRGTLVSAAQGALKGIGNIWLLDGGSPSAGSTISLLAQGNQTISNALTLANSSSLLGDSYTIGVKDASNATFSGNITALAYLTSGVNTVRNFIVTAADGGTATFSGTLAENAATTGQSSITNLTKIGNGTTVIGAAWGHSGSTTVSQGTLQIGNGGAAGSIASTSGVSGSSGATLAFDRSDAFSFDSAISGGMALNQIGSGTTTLTKNNTYTGATTISSGKLIVSGSTATGSAFTVNSGGILGGSGSGNVGGTVSVNSGGHFAPGNNAITNGFKTGALTFAAGSISDIRLGATTSDRTDVNGALALSGTLNLINDANVSGLGNAGAGAYQIFTQQGAATGAYDAVNNLSGYHAKVDTSTSGNVYVDNYQIAAASDVTAPVHLGIVHVGETFTSSTVSITNTATSNGYAESLNVSQGAVTGHASVGGTITGLAGGATGTSIVVGLGGTTNTATAGAKAGTVSLGFASDGTGVGSSGYAPTTLASQTIAVDGQVNQYAKPTYTQASGDGTLAGSGTSYTFNLGTFDHGSGTYTGLISLNNVLVDPQYQDLLNGTFTLTGQMDKFILSGLDNLTDIGIGLNHTLSIGFDSGSQPDGTYIGHILFNPMSVNGDTPEALSQIDMTVEFQVVPEPATWGMVLSGFGMLIGIQRLRRNRVGTR